MKNKNFGGNEILHVAEAVARDKGISKESIIESLEEAIAIVAKNKYGTNIHIRASINRNTGSIVLYREILVVSDISCDKDENKDNKEVRIIGISKAKETNSYVKEGDIIKETLPPLAIGRLNAISVKQIIIKKVQNLEKDKIFEEYKHRIGDLVNGIVEKIETGGYIVRLGSAEATLKKDQVLKTDFYKLGDRIKACLIKLDKNFNGPILLLSRTHQDFVIQLFKQEVPEIYDRIIEIKSIAREPGSRTKIAVYSSDISIDSVGSCVGIRGTRVQAVIKELNLPQKEQILGDV